MQSLSTQVINVRMVEHLHLEELANADFSGLVVYVTSTTHSFNLGNTAAEMVTSQRFTQLLMGQDVYLRQRLRGGPLPESNMRKWHSGQDHDNLQLYTWLQRGATSLERLWTWTMVWEFGKVPMSQTLGRGILQNSQLLPWATEE